MRISTSFTVGSPAAPKRSGSCTAWYFPSRAFSIVSSDGVDEAKVRAAGQMLARTAPVDPRIRILGPAPAPLSKLRGQYRYRLLMKADRTIGLQTTLRQWLKDQKFSGVRIKIDVNPYYFM